MVPAEGSRRASTGHAGLDGIIDSLRLGDNVVWQVDSVDDYRHAVALWAAGVRASGAELHYMRFSTRPPVIEVTDGVRVHDLDPGVGFEGFAPAVHRLLAAQGRGASWVFDCLTDLLDVWHSDLTVLNFFQATCPYLFELETIAYFALLRNRHTHDTVAGIRSTTQVLLDLHQVGEMTYVHPLKVFERHSPTMFFPHELDGGHARTITSSAASAALFARFHRKVEPADPWDEFLNRGWDALGTGSPDEDEIRRHLLSRLVGRAGPISDLCERYLGLADLLAIASREIGTGAIGGKSVGMLVARAILAGDDERQFDGWLEPHDSFYLGSDLFFAYMINNGWWALWTHQNTPDGYFSAGETLHNRLSRGVFPHKAREQFLRMLEHFGQAPIIVRSSSLLEDDVGNAFAGKYDSVFCANQGTPEERLTAFEDAVRTVYASTMSPDALAYRLLRGLQSANEQMAILVQRVSGDHHGDLFFPHAAGVGNSTNQYAWEPGLDPSAGMLRLVVGLGTRAVDRTGVDYPRLVSLDAPQRTQFAFDMAARYSQHQVDVLDLPRNALVAVPAVDLRGRDIKADWSLFASPDVATIRWLRDAGRRAVSVPEVLDFAGLLRRDDFAPVMRAALGALQAGYGGPVDIEFTVNLLAGDEVRVNIVQCRPLRTLGATASVEVPDAAASDCLFAVRGDFLGGSVDVPIEHVVFVKAEPYLALSDRDRYSVARQIGAINKALAGTSIMMVGPGRWGTTTPSLGVPVHFSELSNAVALVEYTHGDFRPELSYGSHFFLDLVEFDIFYAAVLAGNPGVAFHPERVLDSPNLVGDLVPGGSALADVLHVSRPSGLVLRSDAVARRAVCG